ncbi:MerR family transcriptional regulator [Clostridium sp. MSJ-4]|uniref:MerR family transcriptional regulator n=1 Tax=Clostridium simiarum TaxID=2841506 RepID=A0ABS6F275_9CLOT|nr:MerR family transcriptional regulator [Clostridium simiarum]MBU5592622.1 MerR family transcriptional regulator [Clostridium simiarum]
MKLISIGELSKISGSTIRALRYYDDKGFLKPEYIDHETNYRYYSADQLGKLTVLQMCSEFGIPLKKLELFQDTGSNFDLSSMISEGEELLRNKLEELKVLEARMDSLKRSISNLQEKKSINSVYKNEYPERIVITITYDYVDPYSHSFSKMITDLYKKVRKYNLTALYNQGVIKVKDDRKDKMVGFIEVKKMTFTKEQNKHLVKLPAGNYQCELFEFEDFRSNFNLIWNQKVEEDELVICSDIFDSNFSKAVPYIEIQKLPLIEPLIIK